MAFTLASRALAGLDVVLAPLALQDEAGSGPAEERPAADLLAAMAVLQRGQRPLVRPLVPGCDPPRSALEAARLCEERACSRLLYGYFKRSAGAVHAEVKLFDREAGQVAAVFFASDDEAHYGRLVGDVASKILQYFHTETGIEAQRAPEPQRNLFLVELALGAWTPVSADWSRVTSGLFSVGAGIRFIPARPMFAFGPRGGYMAAGVDIEYSLGINEPGYESALLHSARIRLPIEAWIELADGHSLGVGAGPLLQVDTVAQDRLYGSLTVLTTAVPGVSLLLGYRYELPGRFAVGMANAIDWAAYSQPMVTWSPRLFGDLRLQARAVENVHE